MDEMVTEMNASTADANEELSSSRLQRCSAVTAWRFCAGWATSTTRSLSGSVAHTSAANLLSASSSQPGSQLSSCGSASGTHEPVVSTAPARLGEGGLNLYRFGAREPPWLSCGDFFLAREISDPSPAPRIDPSQRNPRKSTFVRRAGRHSTGKAPICFRSMRTGPGGACKSWKRSFRDRWAKNIFLGAKLAELFIFEARQQADRNCGAAHRSATIRADFAARVRSEKRREI